MKVNIQKGYNKIVLKSQSDIDGEQWDYSYYWNSYTSLKDKSDGKFILLSGYSNNNKGDWIWNTAYFSKLLIIAINAAPAIEYKYILKLLNYAKSKQQEDGSYHDYVHISHYCSKTPKNTTRIPLTAFILSAFLELNDYRDYKTQIDNGIKYLNDEMVNVDRKRYFEMSITAYALALYVSKEKTRFQTGKLSALLEKLIGSAQTPKGKMFWRNNQNNVNSKPTAVDIETASYALLAMLKSPENERYKKHILETTNWLLSVKNAGGGYESTHDTGKMIYST